MKWIFHKSADYRDALQRQCTPRQIPLSNTFIPVTVNSLAARTRAYTIIQRTTTLLKRTKIVILMEQVIYLRMFYAGFALKKVLVSLVPSFFTVNGILKKNWILGFFTRQINQRSLTSLCNKGTTESTLEGDSLVPLTRHDRKDLRLICSVMKHKVHFQILSGLTIWSLNFLKKLNP